MSSEKRGFDEVLFTGLIWAYFGIIFGTVFIGLVRVFEHQPWPILPEIPAAALSGAIGAIFYASMQLTVFATMAGALASFGLLVFSSGPVHPLDVFWVAAAAGLLVGAAYALIFKTSRVYRADAKVVAGLCAGIISSTLIGVLFVLLGRLPVWLTTLILCATTGFVYAQIAPAFTRNFHDLLPPAIDGAVVGAGVAAFVGLMIWIFVAEVHSQYTGPYTELALNILDRWPQAAGGAALGGALAGVAVALMGKGIRTKTTTPRPQ